MDLVTLTRKGRRATLRFGRSDKRVNVLDEPCIVQLEEVLNALEADPPEVLVFASDVPGCFIAGADIDVILAIDDEEEARSLAERGQGLCRRIEDLPSVSIAVVSGACLGGGLELALACDHLLAVRGEKTRLGLPEIRLGIHPGFGGCVRLPKKVGWMKAVDMILSGKPVDANQAGAIGLADLVCHAGEENRGIRFLAQKGKRERKVFRPWWLKLWPAKRLFFSRVRKRVAERFKHLDLREAYPAIPATIDLLEEIMGLSDGLAYAREAESIGRLIVTPTCKNLIHVFRLGEALKHQDAVRKGEKHAARVKRVAVYGAGVMGSGIAWVASKTGWVDLHDVSKEALAKGMRAIHTIAKGEAPRMERIRPALDDSGLALADAIIEAVIEDIDAKNALWKAVEGKVGNDALLLSNTSSLSISSMQKVCKRPGRMAGMHFFNPAHKMPLVEVIAGSETDMRTIQCVSALAVRWGKYPVIVKDAPGFLVNRCLLPYLASALKLAEQGQRVEHLDGALKAFGMPMGAFELMDRIGLDICWHVGLHLSSALDTFEALPEWLGRMVNDGLLGAKVGKGFFLYSGGKQGSVNPEIARYGLHVAEKTGTDADIGDAVEPLEDARILDACLLPMLAEALHCLREEIVERPDHLDAAMVYGIGFPPFRGGLMRYFSQTEVEDLRQRFKAVGLQLPSNFEQLYA